MVGQLNREIDEMLDESILMDLLRRRISEPGTRDLSSPTVIITLVIAVILWLTPSYNFYSIINATLGLFLGVYGVGYASLSLIVPYSDLSDIEQCVLAFPASFIVLSILGIMLKALPLKVSANSIQLITTIYMILLVVGIIYLPAKDPLGDVLKQSKRYLIGIILFSIGIWAVHVYPTISYSLVPGGWLATNSHIHTLHPLLTGEWLSKGTYETTIFTTTIYNYLGNIAYIGHNVVLFGLLGVSDQSSFLLFSRYLPIYSILVFPIVGTYLSFRVTHNQIRDKDLVLIYLILGAGSFRFLRTSLAAVHLKSIILVATTLYFLLFDGKNSSVRSALFVIFSIITILFNQTASLVLGLGVFMLILFSLMRRQQVSRKAIIYMTMFSTYLIYQSGHLFEGLIFAAIEAINQFGVPAGSNVGREAISTSIPFLLRYIGFLSIVSLFALYTIMVIYQRTQFQSPIFPLIMGVALSAILLFGWQGVKGVPRAASLGLPFLALTLGSLLGSRNAKIKQLTRLLILICVMSTSIAHMSGAVVSPMYLSQSENNAVEWYSSYGDKTLVSGFRIAGGATVYSEYRVTGISGSTRDAEKFYKKLYDKGNADASCDIIDDKYDSGYILISDKMRDYGIWTYTSTYKPLSEEAERMYQTSPLYSTVYDSDETVIYNANC